MTTKQTTSHLYSSRIDLPETTRAKVVELLNGTLAASLDIWTQAKQAHWNVKGKDFYQLHLLFDDVAETLYEPIDNIAERITALGGIAHGTARNAAANSLIPEYPDVSTMSEEDHLNALADRVAKFGKHLRDGIAKCSDWNDQDTNDLFVEISREVDKKLWFIESHLQRQK
jgi:starvation-inducible DNA-binding protein